MRNDHLNLNFYRSLPDILRKSILKTELTNENKQYGMYLKEFSKDKIFLLSIDEVMEYMPNFLDRVCLDTEGEFVAWYLRSPGQYSNSVSCVLKTGALQEDGDTGLLSRGIRPAFWLDLTHIDKIIKIC